MTAMRPTPCVYATVAAEEIARFVSDRYGLGPVTSCRLLHRGFNDTYALATGERRWMARLSRTGRRRSSDLEYEGALLAHLDRRGVPVGRCRLGENGRYSQILSAVDGPRWMMVFGYLEGRSVDDSPTDAMAQGETLACIHVESSDFTEHEGRISLDFEHLVDVPVRALCALVADRPDAQAYLTELADRLRARVSERSPGLAWGPCHGDCHGGNARIAPNGSAAFFDFDDGGPGWIAYDLAVFLWGPYAFAPHRRSLWRPFLEGYRRRHPIERSDLDAVPIFIAIRHLWLLGEYAVGSPAWGSGWLDGWFGKQLDFLKGWEAEHLSNPLRLAI